MPILTETITKNERVLYETKTIEYHGVKNGVST